jgi:hypothetical protein
VTLGVETSLDPAAEAVWCTWRIEGRPQMARAEGVRKTSGETSELWEVRLPAFAGNVMVYYQLHAGRGDEVVDSQEFGMPVSAWTPAKDLVSVLAEADGLKVILSTGRPDLHLTVKLASDQQGGVAIQIAASHPAKPGVENVQAR